MLRNKTLFLVVLFSLLCISCGTDGLNVEEEQLSFSNTGPFFDAIGGIPAGQSFSYTLDIENGTAEEVNLTQFSENGDWLEAELVSGGSQVELSGTPTSGDDYDYALTAIESNENNAYITFTVEVF